VSIIGRTKNKPQYYIIKQMNVMMIIIFITSCQNATYTQIKERRAWKVSHDVLLRVTGD